MPSVELLLGIVGLPRSTFYYQLAVQSAEGKYADLKRHIHDIYQRYKGRYGYRRIAAAIRHAGIPVNHKKVSRLMAKTGLKAVIRRRKYRSFKGEVGKVAQNILQRCFHSEKPNEKWVTDVTEFDVGGEKIYLSPIMDLFNGEIVSYRIQTRPTFDLAGEILKGAPEKPGPSESRCCIRIKVGNIRCFLSKAVERQRSGSESVPQGKLLGQCGNGKFLRNVEIGMFPYVQI